MYGSILLLFFPLFPVQKIIHTITPVTASANSKSITSNVSPSFSRTFQIDYDNDVFLKDGRPFQYVAGSLHYFRVPQVYWRDRLKKFRAAGLNAVSTYVEWSSHEPSPRNYQFEGDNDLEHFLDLAVQEDLLVILRPGPYICAERDFGGLPAWLLNKYPSIQLRTSDKDYKNEVKVWFDELLRKTEKYLYGNGGPIIMVQVENEYGNYDVCDMNYKIWLKELMSSYVKNNAVLFTTDGASYNFFRCGAIPGVFATIDFGPTDDVKSTFDIMRHFTPKGPLVNSEFYPGWFARWEEGKQTVSTDSVIKTMKKMLDLKASFNFYMFFGGTNFGFTNGANMDDTRYKPQITSYDYNAPLTEAGDPTEKYYAIRDLLSKYFEIPNTAIPIPAPKGNYGPVTMASKLSIFNYSYIPDITKYSSEKPLTFEQIGVYYGYVLYETRLPNDFDGFSDKLSLNVEVLRDRANVFLDEVHYGVLSRAKQTDRILLDPKPNAKLHLLVENQGRINYGPYLKDSKGIISNPKLDGDYLTPWTMVGLPLTHVAWIEELNPSGNFISPPAYYYGELILPAELSEPLHTYIDLTGWGKGVIFINDHNLGRYWPDAGPQITLFVPASYLKPAPEINKIVVFETEKVPGNMQLRFVNETIELLSNGSISFGGYRWKGEKYLYVVIVNVFLIVVRQFFSI